MGTNTDVATPTDMGSTDAPETPTDMGNTDAPATPNGSTESTTPTSLQHRHHHQQPCSHHNAEFPTRYSNTIALYWKLDDIIICMPLGP